jgi:uncharacterized membrane protein
LTGAFISGIGLMNVIVWIRNLLMPPEKQFDWTLVFEMAQFMLYGIVFDIFLLFLDFMQTTYGSQNEVIGHQVVLMQVFRFPYLWLEMVIGLFIPLIILVTPLKRTKTGAVLASLLVAVGVYGMRIWWVMGGQYLQSFY